MYELLRPLRIVEASSFVAAPSAGLYLAQMGADVIRVDQIGGGPDFRRWPLSETGDSFYWEGLNKGKRSLALDLGTGEGRELLAALITAGGEDAGLFLTNFPAEGFLAHKGLAQHRDDLVTVRVMGEANGGPALDYTVNCALGFPDITGPGPDPVNHVLPAWDLLTGAYAAFAMLAAERRRRTGGNGGETRIPLMDVGVATVANLGMLAEVVSGQQRQRHGNAVYGAFGRDFLTRDGKRLMVMAITPRQWAGLLQVLGIADAVLAVEAERGVSFATDEGLRFLHRDALFPIIEAALAARESSDLSAAFDATGCCWGLYKTTAEAMGDPKLVDDNPIFARIDHPSGLHYAAPGAAATLSHEQRLAPRRAPRLGEHSDVVLAEVLGLNSGTIAALHDRGIVA